MPVRGRKGGGTTELEAADAGSARGRSGTFTAGPNIINIPKGPLIPKNIEYGVKEGASRHEIYYYRADFTCLPHFSFCVTSFS